MKNRYLAHLIRVGSIIYLMAASFPAWADSATGLGGLLFKHGMSVL